MSKRTCSIEECESPVHGQGLCGKHYRRFQRSAEFKPRGIPACAVPDCGSLAKSRGYCNMHYKRFMRTGSPLRKKVAPEIRFEQSYRVDGSGCWIWTSGTDLKGYGKITVDGRSVLAHRFSWELHYGAIPEGEVIDHFMCYQPSCVNPEHLRIATAGENNQNRSGLNRNNTSGYRGVSYSGERQKWTANVGHEGRVKRLGYFSSAAEAARAAEEWRAKLHRPALERDRN